MNPYSDTVALKNLSINDRIRRFKWVGLKLLKNGFSVDLMQKCITDFEEKEMYEASQGLKSAIEYYTSK